MIGRSLCVAGMAVALIAIIPASAQETQHAKKQRHARQVKYEPELQIYCRRDVPCRPVKKGCHIEPGTGMGSLNEEVCPPGL
jgi:hypothetical protein